MTLEKVWGRGALLDHSGSFSCIGLFLILACWALAFFFPCFVCFSWFRLSTVFARVRGGVVEAKAARIRGGGRRGRWTGGGGREDGHNEGCLYISSSLSEDYDIAAFRLMRPGNQRKAHLVRRIVARDGRQLIGTAAAAAARVPGVCGRQGKGGAALFIWMCVCPVRDFLLCFFSSVSMSKPRGCYYVWCCCCRSAQELLRDLVTSVVDLHGIARDSDM